MVTPVNTNVGASVGDNVADLGPAEIEFLQWRALSAGEGAEFYDSVLADDAVLAVPSPHASLSRQIALNAVAGAPAIETYQILEFHERPLGADAHIVFYEMYQKRVGLDGIYAAISTVYIKRDNRWLMQYHQQTPLRRESGKGAQA
ncbi:nuclear transport factor 2 family protein [Nocardia ninae]|uniref:DUF4440 domain-containing protein n=1 Tax=Nocardia ninae NBRC 108245 TaxID=1210091 RepID=A0A511M6F8_9NOCA|nr:nuclear transport factor 2 family protein [Nocardia ninae]GEM36205.1 hypothetical protein NN4_07240 [Nocardia ninae NBRC 108245]